MLSGADGESLLSEVGADQSIQPGDLLFTVGSVDQGVPPGLLVGEVGEIRQTPQSTNKDITVVQPGNPGLPSLVVVQRFE